MKTIIEIKWWTVENEDPKPEHLNNLTVDAIDHIHPLIQEGYTSGNLSTEVDGWDYMGWWTLKHEDS